MPLSKLRILLVEDDEDNRVLVSLFLRTRGAIVHVYDSAEPALQAIPNIKPDVIVSDIMMPEHDGYWFIQHVRELQPGQGRETPAIALTGNLERSKALDAGFQMHMPKPPFPDELLAAIKCLSKHNKGRATAAPAP
jgi:CheY-like chemotaxis protein